MNRLLLKLLICIFYCLNTYSQETFKILKNMKGISGATFKTQDNSYFLISDKKKNKSSTIYKFNLNENFVVSNLTEIKFPSSTIGQKDYEGLTYLSNLDKLLVSNEINNSLDLISGPNFSPSNLETINPNWTSSFEENKGIEGLTEFNETILIGLQNGEIFLNNNYLSNQNNLIKLNTDSFNLKKKTSIRGLFSKDSIIYLLIEEDIGKKKENHYIISALHDSTLDKLIMQTKYLLPNGEKYESILINQKNEIMVFIDNDWEVSDTKFFILKLEEFNRN